MQTVLAESLGMERGTPKEDTGIAGLSAIEYKEKMATAHVKKLKQEQQELESQKSGGSRSRKPLMQRVVAR